MRRKPERDTRSDARGIGCAVVILAVALSGQLTGQETGMGDPVQGQKLFAGKDCVRCHAVRSAGGRIGPDLGRSAAKGSFFEIAAGMWNHSIGMEQKIRELNRVRPVFENDEFRDLVAFVYFLNYFDEPGDPRVGEVLFTEKHCIQCHRAEGQGGSAGPSLETLPRGVSPLRIAQGLWNHGPDMVRSMRRRQLAVPQFQGTEILDLFAYLRTQGTGRVAREFQSAGDASRGERVFVSKGCSRCHDVFGGGVEIGPDLGRLDLRGSVTQIAGRMWNHWPAMTEAMEALDMRMPIFSEDELADLLAYLFVSRYAGEPGDLERGRVQYRERGCAFCHGLDGEGTLGPPLDWLTPAEEMEQVVQRMWNHAPEMWGQMSEHQIPWPRFEAGELADLLAFLLQGLSGEE